ncbi:uncharacterized protein LOC120273086 [Dioscorea cayenensis subsp. rotundata]|uniref:Uncharacterized protein LOC120273086 n=1 Tax=Dioscorea cayennensis subsp. rotundata TaxID=55577 RepID=A0AB40C773_DIOCR|nr:uncharacterized protein LOC120273086 [Dioscorea cayenensis subsp. rotundata]
MALSQTAHFALAVAFFGSLAFILGVIAENKKPPFGTPIPGKGVIVCSYPSDPTIALGILSVVCLFVSTAIGFVSVFYPYKGKPIEKKVLFQNTTLLVFFIIAMAVFALAEGMMMWATITEGLHLSRKVHHDLQTKCPTAKTGLFGGAAFLALDAALFWLVCQMLTQNVRADHFEEDDPKGDYGQVLATDYDTNGLGQAGGKV